MQFALVDGQRQKAQPGPTGQCPGCHELVIAYCGEKNIWHWHHKGRLHCDLWAENEGEWHRSWKDHFPADWHEFHFQAEDGERHIADVRTNQGWVIEFQHSHITPEERRCRDAFYKKLVWVIDATRRKTDAAQFAKAFEAGVPVGGNPMIRRVRPESCRLLKEWSGSPAPIIFDFGPGSPLWWLPTRRPDDPIYVAPFSRAEFIAIHLGKGPEDARDFDEFTTTINEIVAPYNAQLQSQSIAPARKQATGFQQHLIRQRVRRRRF